MSRRRQSVFDIIWAACAASRVRDPRGCCAVMTLICSHVELQGKTRNPMQRTIAGFPEGIWVRSALLLPLKLPKVLSTLSWKVYIWEKSMRRRWKVGGKTKGRLTRCSESALFASV